MSGIAVGTLSAPASGLRFFSFVRNLLGNQPRHPGTSIQKNAKSESVEHDLSERKVQIDLNPALSYECDSWLRWTRL